MSNTYVKSGKRWTITAPTGGLTTGVPRVLVSGASGFVAIPLNTVLAGAVTEADVCGEHVLAANAGTGVTFAQGDALYWDASALKLTKTATGNTLIGRATAAKAAATATATVLLNNLPG